MKTPIPALSQTATAQLDTLRSLREQGGVDAWRKGFDLVRQDAGTMSEIRAVNDALNARYGFSAFTPKSDELSERMVKERTPAQAMAALQAETPRLAEVRAVFSADYVARKREVARAEAPVMKTEAAAVDAKAQAIPAPVAPVTTAPVEKPAPMFAAVTSFPESIEQVADRRAWARLDVVKTYDALKAEARKVWTEPDKAVAQIRERIQSGVSASDIQAELGRSPESFGALRGSSRLLDRFSAAGAERKQAVASVNWVGIEAGTLQRSIANYREVEAKAETEHRKRMSIEVPGLSEEASKALSAIKAEKDRIQREQLVGRMTLAVRTEVAELDNALRSRFGSYDHSSTEDMKKRVPENQIKNLENARNAMDGVQSVIRMTQNIRHENERLIKNLNRGNTLQR